MKGDICDVIARHIQHKFIPRGFSVDTVYQDGGVILELRRYGMPVSISSSRSIDIRVWRYTGIVEMVLITPNTPEYIQTRFSKATIIDLAEPKSIELIENFIGD